MSCKTLKIIQHGKRLEISNEDNAMTGLMSCVQVCKDNHLPRCCNKHFLLSGQPGNVTWQLAISTFFTAVKVRDSCKQVGSQWTKLSLLSMSQCPFYSFPDSDHLLEFCVGQKMSGGGEMKKGASSSPQTTRKVMVRSMINVHYKLFLSMRNHLFSRYVSHVRLMSNSSRKQYWIMKQGLLEHWIVKQK